MSEYLNLVPQQGIGLSVLVGSVERIRSASKISNVNVVVGSILANEQFTVDLYTLPLGGYGLILAIQWLGSLGPVIMDFARQTMSIRREGRRVLWTGCDGPQVESLHVLEADDEDHMGILLEEFHQLFFEPRGIPPVRRQASHPACTGFGGGGRSSLQIRSHPER